MDSESLQRADRLTLERWEKLPWLLPKAVVLEWTGLHKDELEDLVREGKLSVFKARRKRKFFKGEVASLACIAILQQRIGPDQAGSALIVRRPIDIARRECSH